ncbi:MAG: hypothetical protein IH805_00695 [Proteobacteria bacterium]|nr:hypothetical protein [Pseudomonadota bacterium]
MRARAHSAAGAGDVSGVIRRGKGRRPARVWAATIGGYQVMKKWLSYREYALLGRPLHAEEARYVTEIARRLAALRLLEPALDANYNAVRADPYPWPQTEQERA